MANKFEFIRGTVELYKDKMVNDPELTNELLANDILLTLGYDKRRNLGVKWHRSNTSRQWEIYGPNEEPWFIFRVYGYKSIPRIESDTGLLDRATEVGFSTIVISDGSELDIYHYESGRLNQVSIVHLYNLSKPIEDDILSENDTKIIDALSYSTFNPAALKFDISKKLHNYLIGLLGDAERVAKVLKMEITPDFKQALQSEQERFASVEQAKESRGKEDEGEGDEGDTNTQEHITQLEKQLEELSNAKTQLESTYAELNTRHTELVEAKENIEATYKGLKEASESRELALSKEKESIKEELDKVRAELEAQGESVKSEDNTNAEIEKLRADLLNIQAELDQAKADGDKAKAELDATKAELDQVKADGDKAKADLAEVQSKLADTEGNGTLDAEREKSYIKQIENLSKDNAGLMDQIDQLNRDIVKLKEDMSSKEAEGLSAAKELLSAVEDNPDEDRRYVAVVGDKLFNSDNLTSFVGEAIQELYAQVSFQLMPILFDGDIFPIIDDPTSKDLLINNKTYRIELGDLSEESALGKLSAIFKYFPTVVFIYKTIGTYHEPAEFIADEGLGNADNAEWGMDGEGLIGDGEEFIGDGEDFIAEDVGLIVEGDELTIEGEELTIEGEQQTLNGEEQILEGEEFGDIDLGFEDTDAVEFGADIEESQDIDIQTEATMTQISIPVSSLGLIFWSNKEHLSTPEYLIVKDKVYVLNQESLSGSVLGILEGLIASSNDIDESIKTMRKIDFPTISNFVVPSESTDEGIRIPFTRYKLNIDNFGKSLPIIQAMCNYLGFDIDGVYIAFHAIDIDTLREYAIEEIDTSEFVEPDIDITSELASTDRVHCIISGTVLDMMIMNKEQCDIQASIVTKCLAFKTNYFSKPMYNMEDIESIITEILVNSETPLDMVLMNIGNVIGTPYSFISQNQADVDPEHYSIEINGDTLYVSDMEPWQLLYSLIRLHVMCANNKTVGIRVELNKAVYDFYANAENHFFNPCKDMAVKSFIKYAETRLK